MDSNKNKHRSSSKNRNQKANRNKKLKGKQKSKGLNDKGKEKEGGDMDAFLDDTQAECQSPVAELNATESNEDTVLPTKTIQPSEPPAVVPPQQPPQSQQPLPPVPVPASAEPPATEPAQQISEQPVNNGINETISSESSPSNLDMVARKNEENLKASQEDVEIEQEVNHNPVEEDNVPIRPKLRYEYKEDQWSPINTEGKKQYDRAFLIQLQSEALSLRKPEGLPDLEVIKDRPNNNTGAKNSFDFTPGFVQSARSGRGSMSTPRRSSQQGRGGSSSTRRINLSINTDVKLHEVENAWKPSSMKAKPAEKTEEGEIEEIVKAGRSILNKLTPQKFETLSIKFANLPINTSSKLSALISLIFEKALDEPSFSVAYAGLCQRLGKLKVTTSEGSDSVFRAMLLTNCQREFEKDPEKVVEKEKVLKQIEEAETEKKKKELQDGLAQAIKIAKRRTLGNIRFIGELYKLHFLTGKIICDCIKKLMNSGENDEDSLECLCRLLTTVGKELEQECQNSMNKKSRSPPLPKMDITFNDMAKMVQRKKTTSRVRFMLQDVIDLRSNGWVPRRDDFNPRTIDEIHKEAEKEAMEQQFLNNQMSSKRSDDRASRRSRGGGPQSMSSQMSNDDGWSTVPGKTRFPDAGKLRQIRSSNVIDDNIQLGPGGPGFRMWGSGSSGGNKSNSDAGDMRPPAAPNNRFNALSTSGDLEDPRPTSYMPRSGASSRDSSINRQNQQGTNARKLSHPRGHSKERKELLNSVSNMTKGANVQAQRSRENSASRKLSRTDSKPQSKELTQDEAESKTVHIIDEFLHHCDLEEVIHEFKAKNIGNMAHFFVSASINHVLERSDKARSQIGHLLHQLVKKSVISMEQYVNGLNEVLEFCEDLLVDIPRFWVYIGELISPMIHNDKSSLLFLAEVAKPLVDKDLAGKLVAEVLHASSKALGPVMLSNNWEASGLQWSSFIKKNDNIDEFIKRHKLEFMQQRSQIQLPTELDVEMVKNKLERLLLQQRSDNEEIMDWIDGSIGSTNSKNPLFIRALMTAVCESALKGEGTVSTLDKEAFRRRTPLLQKYLDNKEDLELHALYALQRLLTRLEHPLGVVRNIFDLIYDEEIISEDAFKQWENTKDPNEQEGHAVLMKSLTQFFTWLSEPEDKEEQGV